MSENENNKSAEEALNAKGTDDYKNIWELTEDHKQKILKSWNDRVDKKQDPPSLREILAEVIGPNVDIRCRVAHLVKKFLASREPKNQNQQEFEEKKFALGPDQIDYIEKNLDTMKAIEMAKILFNNNKLDPRSTEVRAVVEQVKVSGRDPYEDPNDTVAEDYKPPRTIDACLKKIYKFTKRDMSEEEMSPRQKKEIMALSNYLCNFSFTSQINIYTTRKERSIFESSFIRFTFDKHDLIEEEIEQYIQLCADSVNLYNIQAQIKKLEELLNNTTEDEDAKISMGLTEAITSARKEYNECFSRKDKLLKNLVVKRSTRLEKQGDRKMSLVDLVEYWQNAEKRALIIKLAEERRKMVKDEVGRLSSLEDLKFQIWGITGEEVLNS